MRRTHYFFFASLLSAASLGMTGFTVADERVIKEYSFSADGIERVSLQGAVGSMTIVHSDRADVNIVLDIEATEDDWFGDDVDLQEVELESQTRGKTLQLRQTDEDLEIEWTIELPTVAETEIDLGVGAIEGEFGATALDVDLGVGEVDVSLPLASTGDIDLDAGVGDVALRGTRDQHQKQAFISQTLRGHGEGELEANLHVGVGSVKLDLDE